MLPVPQTSLYTKNISRYIQGHGIGSICLQFHGIRTGSFSRDIAAELNRQYPGEDLTADVREFLEVANARGWIT